MKNHSMPVKIKDNHDFPSSHHIQPKTDAECKVWVNTWLKTFMKRKYLSVIYGKAYSSLCLLAEGLLVTMALTYLLNALTLP